MAAQEISKKYQTAPEASWRFGGFLLDPGERLLLRGSTPVPLTPRSFDTLLCLVSRAGRLVTKEELMQTVWPGTFVTEANLTNAIVSLRKIVGRDAIRTVSKHGYRFELPVEGEPGIPQPTYQLFSRARELTSHRSLAGVTQARELLWLCIANDPGFAPAWAWLGRACALLAKFSQDGSPAQAELAQAAFHRAFALDPDLACAHQFYTSLQTDMGQARQAMQRLAERLRRHPSDPETCAGLVQALRFCGLLDESIEAHRRAQDLDPTIHTSVAHSWFLKAEYGAAIESYSGRAALYLDAAAWAAMGHADRARDLLRQRLAAAHQSEPMNTAMASLLAIVEGRSSDAVALLGRRPASPMPRCSSTARAITRAWTAPTEPSLPSSKPQTADLPARPRPCASIPGSPPSALTPGTLPSSARPKNSPAKPSPFGPRRASRSPPTPHRLPQGSGQKRPAAGTRQASPLKKDKRALIPDHFRNQPRPKNRKETPLNLVF